MREIGSEFWDVPVTDIRIDNRQDQFPDGTVWFQSGRSALRCIINDIKVRKVVHTAALPEWCCDSIILPFIEAGLVVRFYPVISDKTTGECLIEQDISGYKDCDILFVMDFFGYSNAPDIFDYEGIVIRDLTHHPFCHEYQDADYYFGSLRKWFGVWTGGFAWSRNEWHICTDVAPANPAYIQLRKTAMEKKKRYIDEITDDKDYLNDFEKAEDYLDKHQIIAASVERDVRLIKKTDVAFIRKQRRRNAEYLLNRLQEMSVRTVFAEIQPEDCPMFVPIVIKDRDRIRRHLVENQVYCPVHWPLTKFHQIRNVAKTFYKKELSLVCDQRYKESDMDRMLDYLKGVL